MGSSQDIEAENHAEAAAQGVQHPEWALPVNVDDGRRMNEGAVAETISSHMPISDPIAARSANVAHATQDTYRSASLRHT